MTSRMLQEIDFISGIQKLLSYNNIISISGESGTGKTTLALYLMGNLITQSEKFIGSCIWIQANESFPKKRLSQLFSNYPGKLQFLQDNIFIHPSKGPIKTFTQQQTIVDTIVNPSTSLPPDLSFIVIDTISHHLRYEFQQREKNFALLDRFYEDQLSPLILFCKRENMSLILVHEVTYSPKLDRIRPFFYKLYDRIDKIDIDLHHVFNSDNKNIEISHKNFNWKFQYMLKHNGIVIIY